MTPRLHSLDRSAVLRLLAWVALALGFLDVLPLLRSSLTLNAGCLAVLEGSLAPARVNVERLERGRGFLERSLSGGPGDWRAYAGLGTLAELQGQPEQSLGYWRSAARLAPENPLVGFRLGLALERGGDPAGGLEALRGSGAEVKYQTEGDGWVRAGDLRAAQTSYLRALEIRPGWEPAQQALGETLGKSALVEIARGNLPEAEALLLESVTRARTYRRVHYLLGLVYYRQGRLEEAEVELLADLAWRPDHPWAHSLLADVYRAGGRETEARAAALRAIPLFLDLLGSNPADPGAVQAKIGELYAAAGQWEQAAAAYREAIRSGNPPSGLYLKLGEVYCAVGKTGEARAAYQRALELEAPARPLRRKSEASEVMDACLPVLEQ